MTTTATPRLDSVIRAFQEGRRAEARDLCCRLLEAEPTCAPAWNLLGIIGYQSGEVTLACQCLEKAASLDSRDAMSRTNLAEVYRSAGRLADSEACARQAIRLQPHSAEGHAALGATLLARGNAAAAIEPLRRVLTIQPDHPNARGTLAVALNALGRAAEAEAEARETLRRFPDHAEAHNQLGVALATQGRPDEAVTSYQRALQRLPHAAEIYNNLANVWTAQGKLAEADWAYERALTLRPDYAEAHCNRGGAIFRGRRFDAAAAAFEEALRCHPQLAQAHNGLGNVRREQGRHDEAALCYAEALRLRPGYGEAANNFGLLRWTQGRLDEAITLLRESVRLEPDNAANGSGLLFALNYKPDVDPRELFDEHRRWGERFSRNVAASFQLAGKAESASWKLAATGQRALRVGYVSPDFRSHALTRFFEPVLANHDPERVEAFLYGQVACPDAVTGRLAGKARGYRSTCGLSDDRVAEMIRSDGIDILVDLAGHTANNRLGIFARRPAPVQASWLGYPGTTGMTCVDYYLTDAVFHPPGAEEPFTEELYRLPRGLCCFSPPDQAPEVTPLPALSSGRVTFGSLHNLAKLNASVIDLWARLLHAMPDARLLLFRDALFGDNRERIRHMFHERGIGDERLDLRHGHASRGYLGVYGDIDVSLDVFPYGGGTTVFESLWMGVPVLTLAGRRMAERGAAAALTRVGLTDFIAATADEYVAKAQAWAADLGRLAAVREQLRDQMATTLCDAVGFTRGLEEAFRDMWQRYCAARLLV